jgi:hypothetical protein
MVPPPPTFYPKIFNHKDLGPDQQFGMATRVRFLKSPFSD